MPSYRSTLAHPLLAMAMVAASSCFAIAQQPPSPSRVRGTIASVDGDVLSVKSRSGEDVKLRMTGDLRVVGIIKIALSDIKLGSFVGATTVPGPDGSQNAVEVHVFPEDMRGTGEGSRPYDLRPNSTMTNATVAETVAGNDGQTLMIKYKGGEKKVVVGARYACRHLCPRRQIRTEGGRQDHRLRQATAGRVVRNQSCQRRPRRADASHVRISALHRFANEASRLRHPGITATFAGYSLDSSINLEGKTMPKISSWMPRALVASLTVISVFASAAWAQQPPPVRIRGTIETVDGPMLTIKSREGTEMKVRMTDNVAVFGVARTELSEIKPGSYIGVSAMPEPDGTQKALAVHIFPESQRGAAEGFRPWDLRPNSTMTNATVAETVKGTDGQNILVRYKDGEKKVVVPPGTPIVTFVAGDKSEVKPGAKIIIFGAVKKDDGVLEANRVNIGRDGITPPM